MGAAGGDGLHAQCCPASWLPLLGGLDFCLVAPTCAGSPGCPALHQGKEGTCGSLYIPGFGVRPKPGFREWSLVSGGWDIIPSACWPRLRGGVTSLTLTLGLGVPLRTLRTISAMWQRLVPLGPGGAQAVHPGTSLYVQVRLRPLVQTAGCG